MRRQHLSAADAVPSGTRCDRPTETIVTRIRAILFLALLLGNTACGQSEDRKGNRTDTLSGRQYASAVRSLPDITSFRDKPSDRFLVDLELVRTGHPYKGKNADSPHTGGHVYFRLPKTPIPATDVERFPAIYAVADGVISRIDYSFRLRPVPVSGGRHVSNTRYGIGILFAKSGGHGVEMHYSIEPFIDPGDPTFYTRFIFVKVGQRVKKGDVIARMYLPPSSEVASSSHIHFNLMHTGRYTFQSPSIFDRSIVTRFHKTWDDHRGRDGGKRIPPCMGYKLAPSENPFERKAVDAL